MFLGLKILVGLEVGITKIAISPQVLGGFPPSWNGNTPTDADLQSPLIRFEIGFEFAELEAILWDFCSQKIVS